MIKVSNLRLLEDMHPFSEAEENSLKQLKIVAPQTWIKLYVLENKSLGQSSQVIWCDLISYSGFRFKVLDPVVFFISIISLRVFHIKNSYVPCILIWFWIFCLSQISHKLICSIIFKIHTFTPHPSPPSSSLSGCYPTWYHFPNPS